MHVGQRTGSLDARTCSEVLPITTYFGITRAHHERNQELTLDISRPRLSWSGSGSRLSSYLNFCPNGLAGGRLSNERGRICQVPAVPMRKEPSNAVLHGTCKQKNTTLGCRHDLVCAFCVRVVGSRFLVCIDKSRGNWRNAARNSCDASKSYRAVPRKAEGTLPVFGFDLQGWVRLV